jgi:hypothetical protein
MSWKPARGRQMMTAVSIGVLPFVMVGVLMAAGCGVNVGPTQELTIDEPLSNAAVTDVNLSMGAGKLFLSAGTSGLISGTVRYNVESWKPTVTRNDDSVAVKQGSQKGISGLGSEIVNEWTLKLGKSPTRLTVTAGAYEGYYTLGGLTLQGLSIKDGAAKTQVTFDSPNPGQIDTLTYETGASKVSMTGLANANFKSMDFKGGAGSYTLDFSGDLRTDATVRVKAGVGTVQVIVPKGTAAEVTVSGSLTDVSVDGPWTTNGDIHTTPAVAGGSGKKLTISVDMSVGTLKLVTE